MAINQAMWTHGHGLAVEFGDRMESEWRAGFYIRLVGRQNTTNWLHFGIPTPVIVTDNRLSLDSAMIRWRANGTGARITNVHVFDGENRIAAHDGLSLSNAAWQFSRFAVPGRPDVKWGIGVTVGVSFTGVDPGARTLELSSAGCDFWA